MPVERWDASHLLAWRTAKKWSQREAAAALGCAQSTIVNWESGAIPVPHWVPTVAEAVDARRAAADLDARSPDEAA